MLDQLFMDAYSWKVAARVQIGHTVWFAEYEKYWRDDMVTRDLT